jgi:predicted DCC family thiol-disulfide oxidoreductase YuxK
VPTIPGNDRPVLIYDGRCGFCRIWLDYWRQLTGDRIEYLASEDVSGRFPQIPSAAYSQSVQLVRPDGTVASGACAVFESLGKERIYPWISGPSELAYRIIARHRDLFYQLTRFTFGTRIEPTRFNATSWLFLRALALIYAVAFGSLAFQVTGLMGERGLLPVAPFLAAVARTGSALRFLAVPSLLWIASDDNTLVGLCFGGVVLSALLLLTGFGRGKFERLILALLFVLYLSFASAGQEFLSFQWDSLLLEAGFLAIFLGSNRIVPWLFRWLVFRLYFLSGAVKLLSGDPNWRNLSAVGFHWHTQPLPTVLAWYADKLPVGFQHFATAATLSIELAIPFLTFFPRRLRITGACCLIGLQVVILITGNYAFFNLLTIALTLFLFDDRALARFVPAPNREKLRETPRETLGERSEGRIARFALSAVAVVVIVLGLSHLLETLTGRLPAVLNAPLRYTAPLQIVNTYGLFAVMTTQRIEIIVEGSADGENWRPYEFKYKPGGLDRAPGWVAPHQPRLDWQMWFAALSNYQTNPWFVNLTLRLLEGSPEVAGLLGTNPFPNQPPRYVRATAYEYNFTDWQTHRRTGAWWRRELHGSYLPAVGLRPAGSQ